LRDTIGRTKPATSGYLPISSEKGVKCNLFGHDIDISGEIFSIQMPWNMEELILLSMGKTVCNFRPLIET